MYSDLNWLLLQVQAVVHGGQARRGLAVQLRLRERGDYPEGAVPSLGRQLGEYPLGNEFERKSHFDQA